MNRLRHRLSFALLPFALAVSAGAQLTGDAAGKNFALPIFSNEGFRSMLLRASVAKSVGGNRIELTDMNLTLFSTDVSNRIDTIILSPVASFLPTTNLAQGNSTVRVIRDDMEVTGEQWVYRHHEKRVLIEKNVRVVFHASLENVLK